MTINTTAAPRYARRAMNQTKTAWVDIKIAHMTIAHALDWDVTIQQDIVRAGRRARRQGERLPRADFQWSWVGFRSLLPMFQMLRNRRCSPLTILVRNTRGKAIPAGMIFLIERYPWPFPTDSIRESTFAWFISAAPKAALLARGVPDPPSLGRIMVDTAIVHSQRMGLGGRMWLHAAAGGGSDLATFYSKICKLASLQPGTPIPRGQVSDGRHFYADPALALGLMHELQLCR